MSPLGTWNSFFRFAVVAPNLAKHAAAIRIALACMVHVLAEW
jgi:hypothetical protein